VSCPVKKKKKKRRRRRRSNNSRRIETEIWSGLRKNIEVNVEE
jgi:hypothetical protein